MRRWASVAGRHGLLLLEVHSLTVSDTAQFMGEATSLHFDALQSWSGQMLVPAPHWQLALAHAGLLPDANLLCYPKDSLYTRITLQRLVPAPCAGFRLATLSDLPQLLELEAQWDSAFLRSSEATLRQRLELEPSGQFVAFGGDGALLAAMYTQRVASLAVLRKAVRRTEATLQTPGGAVIQLLGVVARPSAGSLGGVLRSFVLRQAQLAGVQSVCGVTRCRDWTAESGRSYADHVEKGSDRGLRFHLNAGARMRGLVAGYRLEDAANEGHGVLIEYCVGVAEDEEEVAEREAALRGPLSLDGVKLVVAEVVDGLSYGAGNARDAMQTGFMELGLDSVDVVQLIDRLNGRLPSCGLAPTAVFAHPTPAALSAHIFEQLAVKRQEPLLARPSQLPAFQPSSLGLAVAGAAGCWPGGVGGSVPALWEQAAASGDAVGQVPASRWTLSAVVDVDSLSGVQAKCLAHGAFVQDAELFDAVAFGVSVAEATLMDPQQRLLLETAYSAMHAAEVRRASLMGSEHGVFLAISNTDYAPLLAKNDSVYAATGSAISIAAGRLSFVFGLQGPCVSIDTACSSSLVALHAASHGVHQSDCPGAFVTAASLVLAPQNSTAYSRAGMLSTDGRCKTWDVRANGYVRGEGVGALFVAGQQVSTDLRASLEGGRAWLSASAVQQDGRSASLTAPNGSAQSRLLSVALGRAGDDASSLRQLEAHGTGTALGDPTEVSALMDALRRMKSLEAADGMALPHAAVGGVKASIGHLEPAAGLAGLTRLLVVLSRGTAAGNAQLLVLNPMVAAAARSAGQMAIWPVQLAPMRAMERDAGLKRLGGVSSFGYSGTIAHTLLQYATHEVVAARVGGGAAVRFRRRAFAWAEPTHPLLQRLLSAPSGCAALFRSPVAGPLHALMADHVVRGRIIFPGAGYLETARAACSATTSSSAAGAALNGVFFLQPLALEEGGAAWVECALLDSGTFEVRSGSGEAVVAVHCSGHWAAADAAAWRPLGLAAMRERCCNVADTSTLYAAFSAVGLQYGPAFRALEAAWECGSEATARLRRRSSLAGTQVHPADLDGALQVSLLPWLCSAGQYDSKETRLPFAVDSVLMRGPAAGVLWALASASGADAAAVALGSENDTADAQLDGFRTRAVRAEAQQHQEHLYETEWRDCGASARDQAPAGGAIVVGSLRQEAFRGRGAARAAKTASTASIIVADMQASLLPLPALAATLQLVSSHVGPSPPRVWLVSATHCIAGAGVLGLARVARAEVPTLLLGCVRLQGSLCSSVQSIAQMLPHTEPELAGEAPGRSWRVPRLASTRLLRGGLHLHLQTRGAISSLRLEEQPAFEVPLPAGDAELRVHAVGLNFRDVLNVLGEYPGDPGPPGSDCAGVVAAIGGAGRLRPADAVLGFAYAPLGLHARTDARLLAPKPAFHSFEAACTLPSVWGTVHLAFSRAQLRAGQRALLQAAAGGIGLVAVEYAHWLHVDVTGTAGRPQKHRPLRLQRVGRLCSSRDATAFSCGTARAHCGGRLQLVLNSLSADFISVSAAMLGERGVFMEIGKRGTWSRERAATSGSFAYDALALDTETEHDPVWMQGVLGQLSRRLEHGTVRPLPMRAFDLEQRWEAAFRLLQSGGNTGKVVIRISAPAGRGLGRRPGADGRHGRARAAHGALAGGVARRVGTRAGVAQRRAGARRRCRVGAAGRERRGRAHRAVRCGRSCGGAASVGVASECGGSAAVRRVARGGRAVGRAAGPADGGDADARVRAEGAQRVGVAAGHGCAAARGVRALLVGGGAAGRHGAGQLRGGQQLPRRAGGRAAGRCARGR